MIIDLRGDRASRTRLLSEARRPRIEGCASASGAVFRNPLGASTRIFDACCAKALATADRARRETRAGAGPGQGLGPGGARRLPSTPYQARSAAHQGVRAASSAHRRVAARVWAVSRNRWRRSAHATARAHARPPARRRPIRTGGPSVPGPRAESAAMVFRPSPGCGSRCRRRRAAPKDHSCAGYRALLNAAIA